MFCEICGVTSPGVNASWQANYTRCSGCHSLCVCPVCEDAYLVDDPIIQCDACDRWLHMSCEGLHGDDAADKALELGYTCSICSPPTNRPLTSSSHNDNSLTLSSTTSTTAATPTSAITLDSNHVPVKCDQSRVKLEPGLYPVSTDTNLISLPCVAVNTTTSDILAPNAGLLHVVVLC